MARGGSRITSTVCCGSWASSLLLSRLCVCVCGQDEASRKTSSEVSSRYFRSKTHKSAWSAARPVQKWDVLCCGGLATLSENLEISFFVSTSLCTCRAVRALVCHPSSSEGTRSSCLAVRALQAALLSCSAGSWADPCPLFPGFLLAAKAVPGIPTK